MKTLELYKEMEIGALLVERIHLRKQHKELSDKMVQSGPHIGQLNAEIIEQRIEVKEQIALIDKELERRERKQSDRN